jgi:hypothetical protein
MNLLYEDLKEALLELNSKLEFDDGGFYQYQDAAIGTRTSVSLNGEHICNMDTGDIPEDRVTAQAKAPTIIHPDERNFNTTHTKKMVVFEDHPMFFEADQLLGKSQLDVVRLGVDYPAMAQRAQAVDYRKKAPQPEDCIILRFYFELREQDKAIIKIGWQEVLKRLIDAEAIKKDEIEKRLGIVVGD